MAASAAILPPMPPPAPEKGEVVFTSDDLVVTRCAEDENRMAKSLRLKTRKIVITKSPRWGTIWRADTEFPHNPKEEPILFRDVCWKDGVEIRPLEMFDSKASIKPLQ